MTSFQFEFSSFFWCLFSQWGVCGWLRRCPLAACIPAAADVTDWSPRWLTAPRTFPVGGGRPRSVSRAQPAGLWRSAVALWDQQFWHVQRLQNRHLTLANTASSEENFVCCFMCSRVTAPVPWGTASVHTGTLSGSQSKPSQCGQFQLQISWGG